MTSSFRNIAVIAMNLLSRRLRGERSWSVGRAGSGRGPLIDGEIQVAPAGAGDQQVIV
jgi:hypothetical protein